MCKNIAKNIAKVVSAYPDKIKKPVQLNELFLAYQEYGFLWDIKMYVNCNRFVLLYAFQRLFLHVSNDPRQVVFDWRVNSRIACSTFLGTKRNNTNQIFWRLEIAFYLRHKGTTRITGTWIFPWKRVETYQGAKLGQKLENVLLLESLKISTCGFK